LKPEVRLLKVVGVLSQIVHEPDRKHPKERIEKWNQKILDEISVKYSEHDLCD
jgi:hypothetical protein